MWRNCLVNFALKTVMNDLFVGDSCEFNPGHDDKSMMSAGSLKVSPQLKFKLIVNML